MSHDFERAFEKILAGPRKYAHTKAERAKYRKYCIKGIKSDVERLPRLEIIRSEKHNAHLGSRAE